MDEEKTSNASNNNAADPETVEFLEQIESAINEARYESKVLMVLCDSDEQQASPDAIWRDETIVRLLTKYAVCLRVSVSSNGFYHFSSLYPVLVCPTVYFINSSNGGPLSILAGTDINHENLLKAIESTIIKTTNNNTNNRDERKNESSVNDNTTDDNTNNNSNANNNNNNNNSNNNNNNSNQMDDGDGDGDGDVNTVNRGVHLEINELENSNPNTPSDASLTQSPNPDNNNNDNRNNRNNNNRRQLQSISIRELSPPASSSSLSSDSVSSLPSTEIGSSIGATSNSPNKSKVTGKPMSKVQQRLAAIRARAAETKNKYIAQSNEASENEREQQKQKQQEEEQQRQEQEQTKAIQKTVTEEEEKEDDVKKTKSDNKKTEISRKIESVTEPFDTSGVVQPESPIISREIKVKREQKVKKNESVETDDRNVRRRNTTTRSQTPSEYSQVSNRDSRSNDSNPNKRARFAFDFNNGQTAFYQTFNFDDHLIDIVKFVEKEIGSSEFTIRSTFPKIKVDSADIFSHFGRKNKHNDGDSVISVKSSQSRSQSQSQSTSGGLLGSNSQSGSPFQLNGDNNNSDNNEEKEIGDKTLYQLGLAPSCRLFIQPKWKGHAINRNDNSSGVSNYLNVSITGITDLLWNYLAVAIGFGWNGVFTGFKLVSGSVHWVQVKLGLTKDKLSMLPSSDGSSSSSQTSSDANGQQQPMETKQRRGYLHSKGSSRTKNNTTRGGVHRLHHLEKDEDKNKYWNGNSTMFGGDDKK